LPNAQPRVFASIVIPAFRRPEKLREAVRSALHQDLAPEQFEVIVVDSSPDDENVKVISDLQAEARCVLRCYKKEPEGPGPSRNLGAREARGQFLAFMDSDCQAYPQWLRKALAAFEDGVGLVSGRIVAGPSVPKSVFNFTLEVEQENFLYHAANIVYRREPFEAAGGFTADMNPHCEKPMGGEDVDLAWRVKRLGWTSRFASEAVVRHEIVRLSPWQWVCVKRLFVCPMIVQKHPELRRFFFGRYFFDKVQACLMLGIFGMVMATRFPAALVLGLPYVLIRISQPSGTLRGPLRLLRVLLYLPKDLVSMGLLLAGSVRYRALLL
jgi:glycosyltransferase involved in cell wall biosynthesis